jgi:hypothetical protein
MPLFTAAIRRAGLFRLCMAAVAVCISLAAGAGCPPRPVLPPPPPPPPPPGIVPPLPKVGVGSTTWPVLRLPDRADREPSNYPGLHNVVAYAADVYSGSAPEGDAGFDTLRRLGVRTILSVDGAEPELGPAKALGMQYVHLPISYGGITEPRKLEIARAVRDLPKPIYVHCHHGKHRSAGAAGTAAVMLGRMTPEQAVSRMRVSGTAPDYKGLYECAATAAPVLPAVLDAVNGKFPEVTRPQGMVKTMVEIDEASENLKAIQQAGWTTPQKQPDLVPVAEAGRMADHLRFLLDDLKTKTRPAEFRDWLTDANRRTERLEAGLTKNAAVGREELDRRWMAVQQSCKQCHVKYRD